MTREGPARTTSDEARPRGWGPAAYERVFEPRGVHLGRRAEHPATVRAAARRADADAIWNKELVVILYRPCSFRVRAPYLHGGRVCV